MRYNRFYSLILVLIISLFAFSCESEYTKMVNREAERGFRQDSLLFGMKFGYTRQNFYDRCWELNHQKLVSQGPNNRSVQYVLTTGGKNENLTAINMLFYGTFDEKNIMTGMDMEFSYKAWSLWNDNLTAKKLFPVVQDTLMKWYKGNAFVALQSKNSPADSLVKVDGNRQILLFIKNDKDVVAEIDDLRLKYPEKYK